ncbi:MAG TPA: glycosyltransferase family 39 protein [Polyangiaceae bacterium]|jgi:4-amino-4-deoxy-L-arabinose transferase-like glycosyltransferase
MKSLHSAWIAVGAGVVARVAWAIAAPPVVRDDAAAYRALAHAIAEGHGYGISAPTAYWTPGWPAWMGLIFQLGLGDRGVAVASALLGGVTIALVWVLARRLADRAIAWRAAAICALVPSLVLLPGALLSENLAVPLVVLAAIALVRARELGRARDYALFGVAVAAATFVRESCAAFLIAGAAFAVARAPMKLRATRLAAVVLAFSVALAPWVLRNRARLGATTLTTSAGPNLCVGLGDGATGGYRTVPGLVPLVAGEAERNANGVRCAEQGLRDHPFEIVTLAPAKLSRLLVWDDWIVDDFYARGTRFSPVALNALRVFCNLAWWALLGAAAVVAWRQRERAAAVIAFAACVALAVLVTFGAGRFHTPLLPLFAVLAACYRRRS